MIKAILWDLDNTVLDFTAAERASLRRAYSVYGFGECTDGMLEDYARINTLQWEMLERGEKELKDVLVDRFKIFLEKYGHNPELGQEFNSEYECHIGDIIAFIPHSLETLMALNGKVIQCCATNGVLAVQERRLRESGLDMIFDRVFISSAMGVGKPLKEYFERIFAELDSVVPGIQPHEMLMVGDSLTSDMRGASNAGIPKCFFNPKGKPVNVDFDIEYTIRDISEVEEIVIRSA